ncbi:hypothetical protein JW933_10595 [candidate division FCPU426 bacterium]|nr:hypothetical protein [candidate division FCPU426 bacterium]
MMTVFRPHKIALAVLLGLAVQLAAGCSLKPPQTNRGRVTYFIGIDISGSFKSKPEFDDSLKFLSYYIYAHLHGLGNLKSPKALFVTSIGGDYKDDPQVFYSHYNFENKNVDEIYASLKQWFGEKNRLTDFNTFFQSVAKQVKKRNLTLTPLSVLIVSDGIPEGVKVKKGKSGKSSYAQIDLQPLEYLARNVTIRLLYASPKACKNWEDFVPRKRVRLWTSAKEIMQSWQNQLLPEKSTEEQEKLFEWMQYNVDYRVRVKKF